MDEQEIQVALGRLLALRDELGLDYATLGLVECVVVAWESEPDPEEGYGPSFRLYDDRYSERHESEADAADALRQWASDIRS